MPDNLHWRVRNAAGRLKERPEQVALRIESTPNPMYLTREGDEWQLWSYNYTWRNQEKTGLSGFFSGGWESELEAVSALARSGYGISSCYKSEIDTEKKPRGTSLGDFAGGGADA